MRKPLNEMSDQEAIEWVQELQKRLRKKQARELAYLDRRKARNVHTPTDDAYEEDQELENDLLEVLIALEKGPRA
jgi:hypothetical protein